MCAACCALRVVRCVLSAAHRLAGRCQAVAPFSPLLNGRAHFGRRHCRAERGAAALVPLRRMHNEHPFGRLVFSERMSSSVASLLLASSFV